MSLRRIAITTLLPAALLATLACSPAPKGPSSDSQTNWLRSCEVDADCGELSCVCNVCTLPCSDDTACESLPGSVCAPVSEAQPALACSSAPERSCQPRSIDIDVNTSARFQTLSGFGATVGYAEKDIADFPRSAELEHAMFAGLGLDVLRLRNRYGEVADTELASAERLIAAAERSLGREPLVLLSSWSPPSELKANGSRLCSSPESCTLKRLADGSFDYEGLAEHWRSTLLAYAAVGVSPSFIGIQNNPDWAPSGGVGAEACRLLPTEGSELVGSGSAAQRVRFAGFAQALAAVTAAVADLPGKPRVLAPELSGASGMEPYLTAIDTSRIDAIAHHLYGEVPESINGASLEELASLSARAERPLFQTEMQADGLGTALLVHHAVALAGASMYLQTALVAQRSGPVANPFALIGLEGDQLVLQDPYFALAHYSRVTDPGYTRVAAQSSQPQLLASAWLSPDERSLAVVVINSGASERRARIAAGDATVEGVLLTSFDRGERLSELTPASEVLLPPRSLVSWTLSR